MRRGLWRSCSEPPHPRLDSVEYLSYSLNDSAFEEMDWGSWAADNGDRFGARLESFLTNPDDEVPNHAHWRTEVVIRLADDQP